MKKFIILLITVLFSSCGTTLKTGKSNLEAIDISFSGTFKSRSLNQDKYKMNSTAAKLFELQNAVDGDFTLRFDNATKQLLVIYPTAGKSTSMVRLDGEFKNGYFEIFLSNENIRIPPLLPIFYSKRNIKRLRIAIRNDDNLIIEHKWARDGNIFLFAGGSSGRDEYYFERI